ncbi:hypothetical protein LTR37_014659 [Vermiconidia calcicola]|uniref:Uncharacterized protein n=1 Tax=Vermiconidia calcicola TaxID=1690605 RepID=A0ACC3MUA6_9PEZI|nr:hypothetical protein LTR37_014659 [Vermiconidia calcicola]
MSNNSLTSTVLVTGGTLGLGYECALAIAKQKPDTLVLVAARSDRDNAAAQINQTTGQANTKFLALDLSSQEDIRRFTTEFKASNYPPLTALILNAGIQVVSGITYTKEGIESTVGVNHVGHALLFHLLAPHLTGNSRVVITSSGVHDPKQKTGLPDAIYESGELLAHPDEKTIKLEGRQRYATSKLCNVLWLYALERHRQKQGVTWTVTAMDPGLMPGTGLARDAGPFLRFLWNHVLPRMIPLLRVTLTPNVHTAKESGENLARLAIAKEFSDVSGKYFEGNKAIPSSDDSYFEKKQGDLWSWTVSEVSKSPDEAERFERFQ